MLYIRILTQEKHTSIHMDKLLFKRKSLYVKQVQGTYTESQFLAWKFDY